jgi:hypothetical protein
MQPVPAVIYLFLWTGLGHWPPFLVVGVPISQLWAQVFILPTLRPKVELESNRLAEDDKLRNRNFDVKIQESALHQFGISLAGILVTPCAIHSSKRQHL